MKTQITTWQASLEKSSPEKLLSFFMNQLGKDLILASSLGAEDQVLTDMMIKIDPKARVFVLDTGRLPNATYETIAATQKTLGIQYEIYTPPHQALEKLVNEKGINLFYESIENRKACCYTRKVEPLKRALSTCTAWVTGIRRAQAVTRASMPQIDWDEDHQKLKLNPLAYWSQSQVWAYIKDNQVPYHPYHDLNYPSIGCEPCTRPVKPGEDTRSGRWWWESPENKECGLHSGQS